jgi:hypothetical protein
MSESLNFELYPKYVIKIIAFMQKLNLPEYEFKLRTDSGKTMIFDPFRAKYLLLTPEENVRQHFTRFLIEERQFPGSYIMTEYSLSLNKMTKRCDVIVFDETREPVVLVECKSPDVKISQDVFDQVARYNIVFKVSYLLVTNGLKHYCCKVDFQTGQVHFLSEIPNFGDLT